MKTVLITGASGFIARNLARTLGKGEVHIVGVSRTATRVKGFEKLYRSSLGQSLGPVFDEERIDAVVHCAAHAGERVFETNVEGTTLWLQEAQARGVDLQIFLSTLIPEAQIRSEYTRMKHELEKEFLAIGGVVFRLGLVIGDGGMFLKIRNSMGRFPLVPLLDGGRAPVYPLGIDFVCGVIEDCIRTNGEGLRNRAWNLQQPTAYSLRDVMESTRRQYGFSCRFVIVPSLPILWAVSLLERLPFLHLPISSTNLKGLRAAQTFPSDFARFGQVEESLDDLISRAVRARSARSPAEQH